MPYRYLPLATGEVYHIFNRSIAGQPVFLESRDYNRALETFNFYSYRPSIRFSHYQRLNLQDKPNFLERLIKTPKQIDLLAFSLMPNHFHYLIRETTENGISSFLRNFQNSYAKFFNTKNQRTGSVFQSMFKAVRIETEEQLLHVGRYININPVTSFVLKNMAQLENCPWTSFYDFLGKRNTGLVNTSELLGYFPNLEKFKSFHSDQVGYQRDLNKIKHLLLE
ncbi:MAG: hypothetical protein A3F33_01655 [Candidatus Woykebacteria bacterium RIFCSPHIGHO2_12_FULL_43_10]|uniref:Transposase IS200-like domain-containing protein n=2 Tax=Candidatus Woykeibacteriota TaxID=1817899 RepID=A0A1G1WV93_9BACT|nr:MAG: hypothetical protein A2802_01855 [Candidatus Woykebacteria bacterium RIFCSPHIGHO2_01_FULL_43_29]OGY29520.1 MAG: hypothetical protein A3F33_01655 [Candidatus Woykebacteria bacterium RIFCSPHIGHO2_12_FULL_43_10]OGY29619.1 MAG: hypothetical protein A3J50_00195 [Candidatus Woykebacteria bacterium RIFCSPHIGHO2_02_FULL_43_16b]OGY31634.1 MAG: hypothetical protein A3A61_00385 [Candidatus Woykebacteria bacterium RIFCSPLOWO2_01_FULL_43_14]